MIYRGILEAHDQVALPSEIWRQPAHVGGSLAKKPGPKPELAALPPPSALALLPGVPTRPRWLNRYDGIVMPFTVQTVTRQIIPANRHRCYLLIQNLNAADDMWVNFGNEAVVGSSVLLIPRGNYELIGGARGGAYSPRNSVHVIGTVADQRGIIVQGTTWTADD